LIFFMLIENKKIFFNTFYEYILITQKTEHLVLEGARTIVDAVAELAVEARLADRKRVVVDRVSSACAVLSDALAPVLAATADLDRVVTLGVEPETAVQHEALGTVRAGADLAGVVTIRVASELAVYNVALRAVLALLLLMLLLLGRFPRLCGRRRRGLTFFRRGSGGVVGRLGLGLGSLCRSSLLSRRSPVLVDVATAPVVGVVGSLGGSGVSLGLGGSLSLGLGLSISLGLNLSFELGSGLGDLGVLVETTEGVDLDVVVNDCLGKGGVHKGRAVGGEVLGESDVHQSRAVGREVLSEQLLADNAVVLGTGALVRQDLVGVVDSGKDHSRLGGVAVLVRVLNQSTGAESLLDLDIRSRKGHTEDIVVVGGSAAGHRVVTLQIVLFNIKY
jgi:hypothetical protein